MRPHTGVRRTLLALIASGLGVVPLMGLFTDYGWLLDVWLTMIIVLAPAAWLRRRRAPGALDIWPGVVLAVPWLTLRFVRAHAIGGVLPGPATWHDISLLLMNLHETTRDETAPIHTTVAVRLVLCALLGLIAALIDLVVVVGRRGALAAIPLLVVYTVAGAVPRRPVSWIWFICAAVGYLVLLGLDSEDVLASWGRRIRPPKASRGPQAVAVSTPRIAVAAVVVAIALPLLVPSQSRNLISDAFHHGTSSGGSGIGGFGSGEVGSIAPFAALKGQLVRPKPVTLMTVQMTGASREQPFYLRVNVLSDFTGDGWQAGDHGATQPIDENGEVDTGVVGTTYPTLPAGTGTTTRLTARISLADVVRGNAPVFAVPTAITGIGDDATWSAQDQLVLGHQVTGATDYTESFDQPDPSSAQLSAAGDANTDPSLQADLALPADLPAYAGQLVARLTRGDRTLYAKARAINDYFTDPDNGFSYSLQTKVGDSGSELVDFLKNKQGYCQQYAAAAAVMLRASGVPARVVLGYMHPATDRSNSFTVTTSDAHAWVEAYFPGQGWIPFDPTPAVGLAGGASTDLAWAPHKSLASGSSTGGAQPTISRGRTASAAPTSSAPTHSRGRAGLAPHSTTPSSSSLLPVLWWTLGVLVVLALVLFPAATRLRRRRSRLAAARRTGDADALWAELSDTATDLGYVWSSARTPRQVARWLARDVPTVAGQLASLAGAVEVSRYAPSGHDGRGVATDTLAVDLRSVSGELRSRRSASTRVRARLWPASLGWGARFGRARSRGFGRREH